MNWLNSVAKRGRQNGKAFGGERGQRCGEATGVSLTLSWNRRGYKSIALLLPFMDNAFLKCRRCDSTVKSWGVGLVAKNSINGESTASLHTVTQIGRTDICSRCSRIVSS